MIKRIKSAQFRDDKLTSIVEKVKHLHCKSFIINDDGDLRMNDGLCVPDIDNLKH